MATSDCRMPILKPGQVLGFFVLVAVVLALLLLWVQHPQKAVTCPGAETTCQVEAGVKKDPLAGTGKQEFAEASWKDKFQIDPSNRVAFFAAWVAFIATLLAAKVGVQNVVRQHTVNTLLQARLSEVFMKHGERMNKGVERYLAAPHPKNRKDRYVFEDDFIYMLNFYEYVAAAIKHGDMSEPVMRDTVRGIVIGLAEDYKWFIKDVQVEHPFAFENLVALAERWEKQRDSQKIKKKKNMNGGLPPHENKN